MKRSNFPLCLFFLLSAKCQECLRLMTSHVKEKKIPRNISSITLSSTFFLFPQQTVPYVLTIYGQNFSCPFQLRSLEILVL